MSRIEGSAASSAPVPSAGSRPARAATASPAPAWLQPALPTFALTPFQKGLLAESMVALDRGANVEQIVWELSHPVDPGRLRAAWQAAVDASSALRLGFAWPAEGGEPQQAVLPEAALPFREVDLGEDPAADARERLERFLEEDRRAGFDLASPPLLRVSLLSRGAAPPVCVWTIHHTIVDGNSYAPVLQRVLDALEPDAAAPRPAPMQFTDFLCWLERHDTGPGVRHFVELLRGVERPTPLPLQQGRDATAANRSRQVAERIGAGKAGALRAAAEAAGATSNALVQLAWALLLARYAGEDDVVFGATWSGRVEALGDASALVGPVLNTLPVRVRLGEAATVREALAGLRRQHLAARPHQQTPAALVKAAGPLAHDPHLFTTVVLYESRRFFSVLRDQDERWRTQGLWSRSQANQPLVLAAYFEDGELALELEYDVGLYTESAARRLLSEYRRTLEAAAADLDRSPLRVPSLDPAEEARLTADEALREVVPAQPTAVERVLARAAASPGAVAVRAMGGPSLTFGQLEARVRGLAALLRARGVGPGTPVALLLPRSIDSVVSLLGVHLAGGAALPLDPGWPPARLEFMLRDAAALCLLVNRATRGVLPGAATPAIDVGALEEEAPGGGPGPAGLPSAGDLAYVIYTSGSTGKPKGVCVSHGALANHLAAVVDGYGLRPGDRVLGFAAPTFDVCLEETLSTLAAGATLVLRSEELAASARSFLEGVAAEGLTVLNLPTAFWHRLVQADHLAWPSCVRLLVVGGEQAAPAALRRFRAADTGHIRWINAYGPTEAAITSTWYDDAEGDHGDEVPIGRPLPGVSHFVLDRHLRPVPPGQPGQLHIGGAGLALGYLGREELTRERFVDHPFRAGARLFATGDRVRVTAAGNHVHLGRLDAQVKVRGFRVELEEIEARLRQHPAVADAAVVVREGGDGALAGFVAADHTRVDEAALREHLAAVLPAFMIPARLVIGAELPTTASGKVDRRALAALRVDEPAPAPHPGGADPLLGALLQIWSDVVGRPVTDPAASFFDLGGDSLLLVQLLVDVETRLHRTCHAPEFLRNPTVASMARLLREDAGPGAPAPVLELAPGAAGVRPLFLAPTLSGRGTDYHHLARALDPAIPLLALQLPASLGPPGGAVALRDLARAFAERMVERDPRGPYAVGGFSLAGIVAMAIAEQLQEMGRTVDLVALLDSVPPQTVPVPSPFSSPRRLGRLARTVAGRMAEVLEERRGLARLWLRSRSAALRAIRRWGVRPGGSDPTAGEMLEMAQAWVRNEESERARQYFDAAWNHAFGDVAADALLLRVALDPFEGPHEPTLGWQRVTRGRITVELLPGRHERVLSAEGAPEVARRLVARLRRREG